MKDDIEIIDVNMDEKEQKRNQAKEILSQVNTQTDKQPERKSGKLPKETKAQPAKKPNKALRIVGRVVLCLVTFIVITFIGAYMTLKTICHGPSKAARDLFVSTILETGQMKFLASWFFTEEEILAITDRNGMVHNEENVDPGLIEIPTQGEQTENPEFDINGIELVDRLHISAKGMGTDDGCLRVRCAGNLGDKYRGSGYAGIRSVILLRPCL